MSRWMMYAGVAMVVTGLALLAIWAVREPDTTSRPVAIPTAPAVATTAAPTDDSLAGGADGTDGDTGVATLHIEELSTRPHDPTAWTQGLVIADGVLYESTGATGGPTTVRSTDFDSGTEIARMVREDGLYGEGLELVDDRLIQLTWTEGVALVFDPETLSETARFDYETEGWGLCLMAGPQPRLVMSDGSSTLYFRDPDTFEVVDTVPVTVNDVPIDNINELECVNGEVWANRWRTDQLLRIDPTTGTVTGLGDLGVLGLTDPEKSAFPNGIAYDESTGTFWLTGKLWPTMFEVEIGEEAE